MTLGTGAVRGPFSFVRVREVGMLAARMESTE